jgi:DnaJ-class molecular chaperone
MGLFGSGGWVECTSCGGSGVTSGDYREYGCTSCGGSGNSGNHSDALFHDKNTLKKGSGKIKVADVAAHEEQLAAESRRARELRRSELAHRKSREGY